MDSERIASHISLAHSYAVRGLFAEACALIEALPPDARTSPDAVAVRLIVCTGLQNWEMGADLARLIHREHTAPQREAAGKFHLARAEALCAEGSKTAASWVIRTLTVVWPEGKETALSSKALAELW